MRRLAFLLAALLALCATGSAQMTLTGAGPGAPSSGGPPPTTYLSAPLMIYLQPSGNLPSSATNYSPVIANGNGVNYSYSSQVAYAIEPVSVAGKFYQLGVYQPGWTTGSNAFTVYHGTGGGALSSSGVTATISSASEATDTTNSFTTAAPAANSCDAIAVQNVASSSPAWTASATMMSLLFTSTVGQEASIEAFTQGAPGYFPLGTMYTGYGATNTTEYLVSVVMPVPGTLSTLCTYTQNAPGAGNTYVVTLTHETAGNCAGSPNDTLLSSTIANNALYGATDLTHSEHVAQGDCVALHFTLTGTASNPNFLSASVKWVPDTNYQYPVFAEGTTMSQTSNGSRSYVATGMNVAGGVSGTTGETSSLFGLIPPLSTYTGKIENFYALLSTAPHVSGSESRTFHMRAGTGTQSDMATCGGSNCVMTTGTTVSDTTQSTVTPGNYMNMRETNSGAPAALSPAWFKYSYDWNIQ